MTFDDEQRSIMLQSALAVLLAAAVLAGGYRWLPPEPVGITESMDLANRLAFAVRWDLPIFLWLAGCVGGVSQGRFWTPADRHGSAFRGPSKAIGVRAAVLQNSLEQTVLAVGANFVLATLLRESELVLIPLLVLLYLAGRATFAWGYARSPIARAFGMALTAAPIGFAYVLAAWLIAAGR